MFTKSGKTLLKNVIRHTDTHNRMLEEDTMWKHRQSEVHRPRVHVDLDDRRDARLRSSCQKVPRAHMDRADETRPHAYTDREPENKKKSTFHMRQLEKEEEADPDRWGHGGYKELYPEYFRSDRSETEDSNSREFQREARPRHKSKKTKKRKEKKEKRDSKRSSRNKMSSSSKRSSSITEKRISNLHVAAKISSSITEKPKKPEERKVKTAAQLMDEQTDLVMNNMIKRKSKRMRVEQWVEKTCEFVNSAEYSSQTFPDNDLAEDASPASVEQADSNSQGQKLNRTYRKRARSPSSSDSSSPAGRNKIRSRNRMLKNTKKTKKRPRSSSSSSSSCTPSSAHSSSHSDS